MRYRPIRFASVGSTNDIAMDAASAGAQPGLVVQADEQVRGKGRSARDWASPRGGLWMSVLLEASLPQNAAGLAPLAVGCACCQALEDLGAEALLRWPNDLMLDDAKVGGILVESRTEHDHLEQIVAGIGINVANDPPVETATRVQDAVPGATPADVRRAILDRLGPMEALLAEGQPKAICNQFMQNAWGIGRELLLDGDPCIPKEIAVDGALIVEDLEGNVEIHRTGSLRLPGKA